MNPQKTPKKNLQKLKMPNTQNKKPEIDTELQISQNDKIKRLSLTNRKNSKKTQDED